MKKLHRWLGVPIAIAMLYMSVSGVLLNHPSLIAGFDAPRWMLPSDMRSVNWGRGAIQAWVRLADGTLLAGGKGGVYRMDQTMRKVKPENAGLPGSVALGAIQALARDSAGGIWAGTPSGAFSYHAGQNRWHADGPHHDIVALVTRDSVLYAFSPNAVWSHHPIVGWRLVREWPVPDPGFIHLLFDLHSGAILGKPGKLLYDAAAVALFLLGVGGLYFVCIPFAAKRLSARIKRIGTWLVRYHLRHQRKAGWVLVVPMMIIPATGLFMQPPLSALISAIDPERQASDTLRPGAWTGAIYDQSLARWVLADGNRLWHTTSPDFANLEPWGPELPVHPMGITGLVQNDMLYIVGAFSGLLSVDALTGRVADALTNKPVKKVSMRSRMQVRSLGILDKRLAYVDLRKGWFVQQNGGWVKPVALPAEMKMPSTYSLWNYLFELHNGRIFRSWISTFYMLHNPIVALGTLAVVISGVVLVVRKKKKT